MILKIKGKLKGMRIAKTILKERTKLNLHYRTLRFAMKLKQPH